MEEESEQNDKHTVLEEREEREWLERQEQQRRESEQRDREEQARREQERRDREERERRDREEREREQNEEREQRAREEREQRERDEVERRAREEQNRIANEAANREQRRQKDLLLAKMKAIDESKTQEEIDPFLVPEPKKIDKKDYTFTKPVENMYQGKPAYDNVTVQRNKKKGFLDDDNDDGFGYQPSFTNSRSPTKQKRKSDLNDDDNDSNSSKGMRKPQVKKADILENLFGSSSTERKVGEKTGEKSPKETSSTLFGGGSSSLDDEAPPASNSHLLPRRLRQPSSTLLRPAINAVDNIDDDIEELAL